MTKIGPCDVTIGPHFFDAMIYIVKDPSAPPALQYAPQQRPMVHYGHPNNFQQYRPYSTPSSQQRPAQYSPAPAGRPGYSGSQLPSQQARAPTQGNAPSPQGSQRPPQGQKGQPAKPSPDPVIQMLATRAAADPELKALMRVVASSQASQEQLRAFQAHIDELNAIIKSREQQEQRQQSSTATPPAPQSTPTPQSQPQQKQGEAKPVSQEQPPQKSQTPSKGAKQSPPKTGAQPQTPAQAPSSQPQAPQSATGTATIKQESSATAQPTPSEPARPAAPTQPATPASADNPAPTTTGPQQQTPVVNPTPPGNAQQAGARPGPPYPPYPQPSYGSQPQLQSRPPQYGTPAPFPRQTSIPYVSPAPAPRVNYKSVVFEFTSPLTPYGSSTSGHAGSGDRYLFPEYTILEWLPAENTVIASFLVVRKVAPGTPFPLETPTEAANSKAKGKAAPKSKKADPKTKVEGKTPTDTPAPSLPSTPTTATPQKQEPSDQTGVATPSAPANEANLKEYWQPVTFRIHAPNAKILEPLARVVKPADEVRKYMNDIMDRAERAPDGYLALRLPREDAQANEPFEKDGTPASANVGSGTRSRLSRVQLAGDESEVENSGFEFEEDEEELKDFYDAPSGLPPLKV
jgi:hypothetical protein